MGEIDRVMRELRVQREMYSIQWITHEEYARRVDAKLAELRKFLVEAQ